MHMKQEFQGAEAKVSIIGDKVHKIRKKKSYRHPIIDERLRKTRTRKEAKILKSLPIPGPKFIESNDFCIVMEKIEGDLLAEVIEQTNYSKLGLEIGKMIKSLHDSGIVHGDLTTSNMILGKKVFLIDYGLSFHSDKTEDRAVDLHLLKQALDSKHYSISSECFQQILKGYNSKVVQARLAKVEQRGRHKAK